MEEVKKLRDETGISIMQCKKALEGADGDMEKARIILRKHASQIASKKADRELGAGVVQSYIHTTKQVGTLVELFCETDFVAQNSDFIRIAQDIALHATAMNPEFIRIDDVPPESRAKVTEIMTEEISHLDKPAEIKEKILQGKINDYFAERVLMSQNFVKDSEITIASLIDQGIQKLGEKIVLGKVVRFEIRF